MTFTEFLKGVREVGFASAVALILILRIAPALDALTRKVDQLAYVVEHGHKFVEVKR